MIVDLSKFQELDPGNRWVIFWSFDSCLKKKGPLLGRCRCHSTESQLGLPKLPKVWLSDLHLSALSSEMRVLVLKTHVSATWKTLLPIAAPMPPIKTSLSSEFWRVTSEMDYFYAPLTPCHLSRFRSSFASARCTNFQLLTHHHFYHQEFKVIVWQLQSTFYVHLLHMTSSNKAIFQLTTPISHRIVGANNTSAVRTIWVTAYTTNFITEATFGCETTHLKPPLVWSCLKHDIQWTCCKKQQKRLQQHRTELFESLNLPTRKTQRHGLKTDEAIFRTWQCYRWLTANFRNAVGPCMGLSVNVPNGYRIVVFNWLLTWKKMFAFPWIRILFMYWSRGLFLWMVQRKSRFRNLKRVDGTTQEFVSCTFRSVNSKAFYWPNTSSL